MRVDFTQLRVFEDHDWHSDGEFQLFVGAGGQWQALPYLEDVDDGNPDPIPLMASVSAKVWNGAAPRLEVAVWASRWTAW